MRSRVSVRAAPSRTTGWRTSQRRNRRFVTIPSTAVPSSAAASRSSASARVGPQAMILASIGSKRPPISVPVVDPGVDPDPVAGRPAQRLDAPGLRQEPGLGILGVEADLDRVSGDHDVVLSEPERLPGGDAQLVGDEVPSGHELRDGMLDLEPRVHLEERRRPAVVDEELAGAGTHVPDGRREGERRVAQPGAQGGIDAGRRRLLEHLLVPPLDRAVALAEMDAVPLRIEEDLDLDVAAAFDQPLEDEPVVAEGRGRLPPSGREGIGQRGGVADRAHALAATAGRRLHEQRITDRRGGRDERGVGLVGVVVAGEDRDAERGREPASGGLVAHRPDGRWGRPHPDQPGGRYRFREVGVLGEEPETGVDRIGAGRKRAGDDGLDIQQIQRIRPVDDRDDRDDPLYLTGSADAGRDLAAVRDEEAPDRPLDSRLASHQPAPTRQTRHLRHATARQPVVRAASRSRSSVGPSASTSPGVVRPRSGSVRPPCLSRSSHIERQATSDQPNSRLVSASISRS